MPPRECRFCGNSLKHSFCDLGETPFSNSYLKSEELHKQETFYPLHAYVCEQCLLVQLKESYSADKLFTDDYGYYSSYSESWLKHSEKYVSDISKRFGINSQHHVVEIASNDGYLLKFFKKNHVPVLGIEPSANVATAAQKLGIPTLIKFFGEDTANQLVEEGKQADLLIGNNVLAHVPDLNDFVKGLKILLKPKGLITMEFPHLLRLIEENQFDTIYHEHFSYFSFLTVEKILAAHDLTIFDVEELPTHGGSLRIYAKHLNDVSKPIANNVNNLKHKEIKECLHELSTYLNFKNKISKIKQDLLVFFEETKQAGKTIAAYGAPAKGNTLLNYCGIKNDWLTYTVDRSLHKQGRFLPGTHIPIKEPEFIFQTKPDYLLILPWNLKEEIMQQMASIREWNGKFVVPIPKLAILK